MSRRVTRRDITAFISSVAVHVALVAALVLQPNDLRKKYERVNLSIERKERKTAVEEPIKKEEVKPLPEPAPRRREPKVKEEEPPPPPPPEEEKPKKAVEAPPVFDLGDNSFAAADGQGGSWSLNRSEGNTKFAAVAGKDQPSARGTRPRAEDGRGGKGRSVLVPLKDLSARPKPKSGLIAVPPYPDEARRDGIEGAVVLQVVIDKNGRVLSARVIKDPGGGLGEVARTAMLQEAWTPPLDKKGNPVDTVIIYSYRFVLDG